MTVAVIQARLGSSRLPGKVLFPLQARSVLSWVVRAAEQAAVFDKIVVATTTAPGDDAVAAEAQRCGAAVVRGPEHDVLDRFLLALDEYPDDCLVRLTADCPLLDPAIIALCVETFHAARGTLDYLSTIVHRSLPRGLDVEVASAAALRRVSEHATGADRVHVTSAIYGSPHLYHVAGLSFSPSADDLRVTLDTADDWLLLQALVAEVGDAAPPWRHVVDVLRARPDIVRLNAHVQQKPIAAG